MGGVGRRGLDEVQAAAKLPSRSPDALKFIAEHREWGLNPAVCTALVRNPRLPMPLALCLDAIPTVARRFVSTGACSMRMLRRLPVMPVTEVPSKGPARAVTSGAVSPRDRRRAALSLLPGFPRLAFRVVAACHREPLATVLVAVQRLFIEPLVYLMLLGRRLRVHGLERVAGVPRDRSVLVVSNHRSFFDLFIVGWVLLHRTTLRRRVCFPVRANFFYENPLGLFLNVVFAGASMFPPIFRSPAQRDFNPYAVSLLADRLRAPGSLVGFHPEGTRNKSDDPYSLLPAKPGVGELALAARPGVVVVPVFVNGLSNHFWSEVLANLRGKRPLWVVVGAPVDLSRWPAEARHADQVACAAAVLEAVAALGEEERALRAADRATT